MSTFSPYGMGPAGFHVNRPLNNFEREQHLDTKRSASDLVHYDQSIIKFNSTFVEYVDKWYSMRGFMALVGGLFGLFFLCATGLALYMLLDSGFMWFSILPPVCLALLWVSMKIFLADAFTYTHYPIRFNRKNRQVYVFRRNGTIFKAGWEDLYWTVYSTQGGNPIRGDLNVMGHVLDEDGVTVKESIGLSMVDAGGTWRLLQFFEFIRRYMEDGPGPVLKSLESVVPLIMLPPLDREKESWYFGWQYLTANWKGFPLLQILMQVGFFPTSLFRWIVMRTSKIPQWPQWVEDECAIAPDDPTVYDGDHPPPVAPEPA